MRTKLQKVSQVAMREQMPVKPAPATVAVVQCGRLQVILIRAIEQWFRRSFDMDLSPIAHIPAGKYEVGAGLQRMLPAIKVYRVPNTDRFFIEVQERNGNKSAHGPFQAFSSWNDGLVRAFCRDLDIPRPPMGSGFD